MLLARLEGNQLIFLLLLLRLFIQHFLDLYKFGSQALVTVLKVPHHLIPTSHGKYLLINWSGRLVGCLDVVSRLLLRFGCDINSF